MIEQKRNVYKAFGLRFLSEIPLPELLPTSDQEDAADVVIETADLSKSWSEVVPEKSNFYIQKKLLMFELGNAKFCVQQGERIIVSPQQGADKEVLRLIILGHCIGALLLQRNVIPLHGSAVAINGKAYGFIGDSGAGKSTLASAFLTRGYQLLTDDMMAVSFSSENTPLVTPAYPQQKLWQETLLEFGKVPEHYRPLYEKQTKYAVPVSSEFSTEQLPLAGIFELVPTESDAIEILPIQRLDRLHALLFHTYGNFLVGLSGAMAWHFKASANLAKQIDFFQIRRPAAGFTADNLVSKILTLLHQEE